MAVIDRTRCQEGGNHEKANQPALVPSESPDSARNLCKISVQNIIILIQCSVKPCCETALYRSVNGITVTIINKKYYKFYKIILH